MLAQGKTQGSMLQHLTKKNLTTSPFDNTCEAGEVSPEVEAGGVTRLNQVGTQIFYNNTSQSILATLRR